MGMIIGSIIGGLIIGLLGKWIAPGSRDNIPLWLTVICGIGGIFLGSFIYGSIWEPGPGYDMWRNSGPGVDWWRHVWQVVTAAVLVMAAAFVTGRSRKA